MEPLVRAVSVTSKDKQSTGNSSLTLDGIMLSIHIKRKAEMLHVVRLHHNDRAITTIVF